MPRAGRYDATRYAKLYAVNIAHLRDNSAHSRLYPITFSLTPEERREYCFWYYCIDEHKQDLPHMLRCHCTPEVKFGAKLYCAMHARVLAKRCSKSNSKVMMLLRRGSVAPKIGGAL